MAKKIKIEDLEAEYRAIAPVAERFSLQLCEQIDQLLDNERVLLSFPIQSRVKPGVQFLRSLIELNCLCQS